MSALSIIHMNHTTGQREFEAVSSPPSNQITATIGLYKKLFGSDAAVELSRSIKTTADLLVEMDRQIGLYLSPPECTCQPAEVIGYSLACPVCVARAATEEMEF